MAKYAEELIGNWETSQYEPLRQVAKAQYQSNWNKLTDDFNNLNAKLADNYKEARIAHNNALVEGNRNSYKRMLGAEQNLANRGLTGSGLLNVYDANNTKQQGNENNEALNTLLDANKATLSGSLEGLNTYANNLGSISSKLADTLAGITDAEGANIRQLADLTASLNESKANRDAKYSTSGKGEEELDRIYQLITINDIMANDELDETTKYTELVRSALTTPEQAEAIISAQNYRNVEPNLQNAYRKAQKDNNMFYGIRENGLDRLPFYNLSENIRLRNNAVAIDKAQKELDKYTYDDIKNIMGY